MDYILIVSRTPYRISLFGGGTDYPSWFDNRPGQVIVAAINKYCYFMVKRRSKADGSKYRISYSKTEEVDSVGAIMHPVVRETLRLLNINDRLEIIVGSHVRAGSGMGTSSTFTVGLLKALFTYLQIEHDQQTLAEKAIHIEREILGEIGGYQDQIIASYGGIRHVHFSPGKQFDVSSLNLSENNCETFLNSLLLVEADVSRRSADIATAYVLNESCVHKNLNSINEICSKALKVFKDDADLTELGALLDESWKAKNKISERIAGQGTRELIKTAKRNGAYGAKLLGAGGSGYCLILADPKHHKNITEAIDISRFMSFKFDFKGSVIVDNTFE